MNNTSDRWIRSSVREVLDVVTIDFKIYCGLTHISKTKGEIVTTGRIDAGFCTYTKITFEI